MMEDHITKLKGKIKGATQNIINIAGNKDFKGIRMKAVWQFTDATIPAILTYGAEGWMAKKKEIAQLQTIFNQAIKTLLFLPNSTPTTILLAETGYLPIKYEMEKKKIMQAHRVAHMEETS